MDYRTKTDRRGGVAETDKTVGPFVAPTLSAHAAQFLRLKKIKWSKSTQRAYGSILSLFATFIDDRWPVTAGGIIDFLNNLNDRNRSPATIDNYWRHIAAFLRFAHKMKWLDHDPTQQIKELGLEPPKPVDEPKSYMDAELSRLVHYLRDISRTGSAYQKAMAKRDLAVVLLAYTTGARASELAGMEIGDFDFSRCVVRIRAENAKGGSAGWVAFDDATKKALWAWLDEKPKGKTARVFVSLGGTGKAGKSKLGLPLTGHALQQMIKRRCQQAEIPYRNFHALRHSAAYAAVESGLSLTTVQFQLRHARIETTARYAAGRLDERLKAIREAGLSGRIDSDG